MTTIEPRRRNTVRGRPKATDGQLECVRCQRHMRKAAVTWPDGKVCNSCFYEATSLFGSCPSCGMERMLPGRLDIGDQPVCRDCARIRQDYHCRSCGQEARPYRRGVCARCTLRADLEHDLIRDDTPSEVAALIDALCSADRPESVLTWKRSAKVQPLLSAVASGATALTHEGLDAYEPTGRHVEHLRSILVHHKALPPRDKYIAYFTRWLEDKLAAVENDEIKRPVRQFATWHHLRRINELALAGKSTRGSVHSSKQEITETLRFLAWLDAEHGRTIETCVQQDVDQWVTTGPTTRHAIRTFLIWAAKSRINRSVTLGFRHARSVRLLTQEEPLAWIRELLQGDSESLPYCVAGTLLLLYAQPLVKVAEFPMEKVVITPDGLSLQLGDPPSPVPEPFSALLREHISRRPNLRTTGAGSPWLFPGYRPGEHIHPNTLMDRLRALGIDLLGARNTALRELVAQVPAPVVAEMLGYSNQVAQKHADLAAEPFSRYAGLTNLKIPGGK